MAVDILDNVKIYVHGYDLSGSHNRIAIAHSADAKEFTAFGDTTHKFIGGLKATGISGAGHWDTTPDLRSFGFVGFDGGVQITIAPQTGAAGEVAYFTTVRHGSYTFGTSIGDVLPFEMQGGTSDPLVRGTIMYVGAAATGTTTGYQLGAVSATQKLYAVMHVLAASGTNPTLDVSIASDTASDFPSPTARGSFAQATAAGSFWLTPVSGAITDDWWRLGMTLGGTSPAFTVAVTIGIL